MRSEARGQATSVVEVTNISSQGLWLMVDGEELFLPFSEFPWFKSAPLGDIFQVERPGPNHLYWHKLDVDLTLESIRHPEKYPLVLKVNAEHLVGAGADPRGK